MSAVNQPNIQTMAGGRNRRNAKKDGSKKEKPQILVCPVCWSAKPVRDGQVLAHREHGEVCEGGGELAVLKNV